MSPQSPESPSALIARPARPDDYAAFVRLFAELALDDAPPSESEWLAKIRSRTWVMAGAAGVVAYAYCEVLGRAAHIHHFVVAPAARQRGVGRHLMRALAEQLRALGVSDWSLEVAPDNRAAIALYGSFGLRPEGATAGVRLRWDLSDRLPRATPNVSVVPLVRERDDRVERAFDLAPGVLERARQRDGHGLVELVEAGTTAGVAGFVPSLDTVFPFRVRRPELAGALLGALRVHALPEHAEVLLALENDPLLVGELVRAGASIVYERLLLRGAIQ